MPERFARALLTQLAVAHGDAEDGPRWMTLAWMRSVIGSVLHSAGTRKNPQLRLHGQDANPGGYALTEDVE